MKRYFGQRPHGGPILHDDRYWYWDTDLQQGFWVNADGSELSPSQLLLTRWTMECAANYMEIPALPYSIDNDLQMDEGL